MTTHSLEISMNQVAGVEIVEGVGDIAQLTRGVNILSKTEGKRSRV